MTIDYEKLAKMTPFDRKYAIKKIKEEEERAKEQAMKDIKEELDNA